jgi:hypothetical protein
MSLDLLARTQLQQLGKLATSLTRVADEEEDPPPTHLGLSRADINKWSYLNVVKGITEMKDKRVAWKGFEADCHAELIRRKVVPEPAGFGSCYVPYDVLERPIRRLSRDLTAGVDTALLDTLRTMGTWIQALYKRNPVFRFIQRVRGLRATVGMPRISASADAYWHTGEAFAPTESQQTFESVAMSPKTVSGYAEISRQLLLQSSPDISDVCFGDLGGKVGEAVFQALLTGTGGTQPSGLCAGASSNIGSVSPATVNHDVALEYQSDVLGENALLDLASCAYISPVALARACASRARFSNGDSALWEGNLAAGQLAGFPAFSTEAMPSGNLLFGDWSSVMLGEWGVLELLVNPYMNHPAGIVGVKAVWSIDLAYRHFKSFSLGTGMS